MALDVTEAVILMAGAGSRLSSASNGLPKALVPLLGRPLITYTLAALETAGVRIVHAITGGNGDVLSRGLAEVLPASLRLNCIANPAWQKQNGVSVLCAAGEVGAPFFLLMGDHLFAPAMFEKLRAAGDPQMLNLAVDRKLPAIFDLDDAMKVRTDDGRVTAIAKDLAEYNAIDTGLFLCPEALFVFLRCVQVNGDCSLADGVRAMAEAGKVRAIDMEDSWWQDVDTPEMLAEAGKEIARGRI